MHTRGRGCKARRSQTGLSASRSRKSGPCKDGSRGGEKTAGSLCPIYRSAGKTSDAARSEHCVSRRRQQTTTLHYGEKVWDMGKSSETCGYCAFRLRNNSDDVQLRSDDEMDCLACQDCFKVCLLRQYTLSFQNWTLPCARNAEMYPAPC